MSTIAPAPAPAPVAPTPKKRSRKWLVVTGFVVTAVVGIALGSAGGGSKATEQAAAPAPVTVTAEAPPAVTVSAAVLPAVTVTAAAPAPVTITAPAAAPVTVTAAPAAPAVGTVPRDGISIVGTSVQPGTYSSSSPSCYFARLSDTSGTLDGIITNGNGATIVTIDASDRAFESRRCAPWTAVG